MRSKKRIALCVSGGVLLLWPFILPDNPILHPPWLGTLAMVAGFGLSIAGCYVWAKEKHRSGWWSLFGLLGPLGFVVLMALDKGQPAAKPKPTKSNAFKIVAGVLGLVFASFALLYATVGTLGESPSHDRIYGRVYDPWIAAVFLIALLLFVGGVLVFFRPRVSGGIFGASAALSIAEVALSVGHRGLFFLIAAVALTVLSVVAHKRAAKNKQPLQNNGSVSPLEVTK